MNSSQLLNSLNSQSHNKHKQKKSKHVVEEKFEYLEDIEEADNQFNEIQFPTMVAEPPYFLAELLEQQRKDQVISSILEEEIARQKKQRQRNIYLAFNESHLVYLAELTNLANKRNSHGSSMIVDVLTRRFNNVTSDLENGKMMINRDRSLTSKNQIEMLMEMDKARLLKIKEGNIKSKIDLLNIKMKEMEEIQDPIGPNLRSIEELNKKIQENLDLANYGLNSEKTKIAKDYVKYMGEQRREMKKREKLREERRKKIEEQREVQIKQADEVKDLVKKQQILQRIEQTRKKREEQEKAMAEKQAKIQQFLSVYRQEMPIYKKKEKQFEEKFVKPMNEYRQEKLKEIKQKKKSYSLNDIAEHQKKYEQIRQKESDRKQSQKNMYIQSLKISKKQYFKGSIHEFVGQIDKEARQKNIAQYRLGKNRHERMLDYGSKIKVDYKPKIDESKRSELLNALEKEKLKKNKMVKKYRQVLNEDGDEIGLEEYYEEVPVKNRYLEGNKYMEYAKLKRSKIASKSVQIDESEGLKEAQNVRVLKRSQTKQNKSDSQREVWEIRAKNMGYLSNNLNSPKEFEHMKVKFESFDKKAADKESLLKHSNMSIEEHIQQKGVLDQFYLESIKNKMKLLE